MTPFPHAHVDRFTIRQRLKAVKNVYEVRVALPDDQEGELVAYVQQKTFALKEDLRFWADESKTVELFRIKARQRFDPRARYRVTDATGAEIGELGKAFRRSLARSTWRIYSADGDQIAWAAERSLFRSLLRRLIGLAGLIPLVGDLIELIPILYHFDLSAAIAYPAGMGMGDVKLAAVMGLSTSGARWLRRCWRPLAWAR